MPDLASTVSVSPDGGYNTGPSSLYLRHPKSAHLDDKILISSAALKPLTASAAISFVYDRLGQPQTRTDLSAVFLEEFSLDGAEASAQIGSVLQLIVERGLVTEIPPGAPVPTDRHGNSKRLLREAQMRLRAGDWSSAVALCKEAGKDPAFATVGELDVLIARYHGERFDGMVEEACMLSSRLTPPAQVSCDALALLAAHRTKDLPAAKLIALHLARWFESPWDLPTVPGFAVLAHNQILIVESLSVVPLLTAIEDLLSARVGSPDECALLETLAQRYLQRQTQSAKK